MAKDNRIDKISYYLNIANEVAKRSTCRRRSYGAIIVSKDDEIIASGYNGAARGVCSCLERGICKREELGIPSGERYELCISVHAEQNAIISASRRDMVNATLYLSGFDSKTKKIIDAIPCDLCRRFILNSGISTVVMQKGNGDYDVQEVSMWRLFENMV